MLLLFFSILLSLIVIRQGDQNVSNSTELLGALEPTKQDDETSQDIKENVMKVSKNPKRSSAESWFVDNNIVPEIIPFAPKVLAYVTFPSNVRVFHGNYLAPSQVKMMPKVAWNASWDNYYTLIAIDPDLPSRMKPTLREFLHWSVVNIPGYDISNGTTIAEYIGAGPPAKSGLHRFVFFVFQQPDIIDFNMETTFNTNSTVGRNGFSTVQFANKYNLGDPIAGNFFQTSHDDYVSTLYKKLGISRGASKEPEIVIVLALCFYVFRING